MPAPTTPILADYRDGSQDGSGAPDWQLGGTWDIVAGAMTLTFGPSPSLLNTNVWLDDWDGRAITTKPAIDVYGKLESLPAPYDPSTEFHNATIMLSVRVRQEGGPDEAIFAGTEYDWDAGAYCLSILNEPEIGHIGAELVGTRYHFGSGGHPSAPAGAYFIWLHSEAGSNVYQLYYTEDSDDGSVATAHWPESPQCSGTSSVETSLRVSGEIGIGSWQVEPFTPFLSQFGGGLPEPSGGATYEIFVSPTSAAAAALRRTAGKNVKPTVAATVTMTRRFAFVRAVSPTAGATMTLAKTATRAVAATVGAALTVATSYSVGQAVTATCGAAMAMTRVAGYARTISPTSGAAATLVRTTAKAVTAASGATVTGVRAVAKPVAFTAAATLGLTKTTTRRITATAGSLLNLATSLTLHGTGTTTAQAVNATLGATMSMRRTIKKIVTFGASVHNVPTLTKTTTKRVTATFAGVLGLHRRPSNLITPASEAADTLTPASETSSLLTPAVKGTEV